MKAFDWMILVFACILSTTLGILLFQHVFLYARFELENSDVFFGVVQPDTQITKSVVFSNKGNKALVIKQVIVGCGCTEVKLSSHRIPPGKEGAIEITLTGKSLPGNDSVPIHFLTNDHFFPVKKMTIYYTSVSDFFFNPKQLDFGLVQKNDLPLDKSIKMIEQRVSTMTAENLKVLLDADFLKANIIRDNDLTRLINIRLSENAPLGHFYETLCIANESKQQNFFANIVGTVRGDIYANPSVIDFGNICFEDGYFYHDDNQETVTVIPRNPDSHIRVQEIVASETVRDMVCYKHVAGESLAIVFYLSPQKFTSKFSSKEIRGRVSIVCSNSDGKHFTLNIPVRLFVKRSK